MRREFELKDPGEGIHEVDILEILVAEGEEITEGQEVMVVESDKAAVELPTPYSGTVREIRVNTDQTVTVGDVLMVIEDDAQDDDAASDAEEREDQPEGETNPEETPEETDGERKPAGEPDDADQAEEREKQDSGADEAEKSAANVDDTAIRAAPAARKLAAEHDLDLSEVEATGADGQVTLKDVKPATRTSDAGGDGRADQDKAVKPDGRQPTEPGDEDEKFGPVNRIRASALRLATARNMRRSWSEIPHVWHKDIADITRLERWRQRHVAKHGDLPITPILIKAAVSLMRDFPTFNASFDADSGDILLYRYFNVNVAVATERGLVTPVIQDADGKSVMEISEDLADLVGRAQNSKLGREDMWGGTFTITNIGSFGGRGLSPLINPPQTAILGAARAYTGLAAATSDPGPVDPDKLENRLYLPLVVAFDHRVIDGAEAARFMNELINRLSDPMTLVLET